MLESSANAWKVTPFYDIISLSFFPFLRLRQPPDLLLLRCPPDLWRLPATSQYILLLGSSAVVQHRDHVARVATRQPQRRGGHQISLSEISLSRGQTEEGQHGHRSLQQVSSHGNLLNIDFVGLNAALKKKIVQEIYFAQKFFLVSWVWTHIFKKIVEEIYKTHFASFVGLSATLKINMNIGHFSLPWSFGYGGERFEAGKIFLQVSGIWKQLLKFVGRGFLRPYSIVCHPIYIRT